MEFHAVLAGNGRGCENGSGTESHEDHRNHEVQVLGLTIDLRNGEQGKRCTNGTNDGEGFVTTGL